MHQIMGILGINKKKGFIGILFSIVAFGICIYNDFLKAGLVFSVAFLLIGFLEIKNLSEKSILAINVLWGSILLSMTAFLSQYLMDYNTLFSLGANKAIAAILITILFSMIWLILLTKWKTALSISSFLLLILTTANHYVYLFRGNELCPLDLISVQTAINVLEQYTFSAKVTIVYSWLTWGVIAFSAFCFPSMKKNHSWKKEWAYLA